MIRNTLEYHDHKKGLLQRRDEKEEGERTRSTTGYNNERNKEEKKHD